MSVYECMCVCVYECLCVCVYLKFSQKRHKTFLSRISNFFESAFSLLYFFVFIFFWVFAKFRPRWVASHFCLLFLSASRGNSCQNLLFTLLPTVSIYQLVFASSLPSPLLPSASSSLSLSVCFLDELHRRLTFYWQLNFRNSQTCRLPLACCMLNFVYVVTVPPSLSSLSPLFLLSQSFLLLDCLFKCHLYSLKGTKNQSSDKQTLLVLNWLCVFIIITVSAFNCCPISTSIRSS